MFDDGRDDDVIGIETKAVGEVVDGLGGVAADDRHVVAVDGPPCEAQDGVAGVVRTRRLPRATCNRRRGGRWSTTGRSRAPETPRLADALVEAAPSRLTYRRCVPSTHGTSTSSPTSGERKLGGHGCLRSGRVRAYENVDGDLVALVGRDVTLDARCAWTMSSPSTSATTSSGP